MIGKQREKWLLPQLKYHTLIHTDYSYQVHVPRTCNIISPFSSNYLSCAVIILNFNVRTEFAIILAMKVATVKEAKYLTKYASLQPITCFNIGDAAALIGSGIEGNPMLCSTS